MPLTFKNRGSEQVLTQDARWETRRLDTGVLQSSGTANHGHSYNYEWTRGASTPNFHARIARGELLPHTPFKQSHIFGEVTEGIHILDVDYGTYVSRFQYLDRRGYSGNGWLLTSDDLNNLLPDDDDISYEIQRAAANIASKGHDTLTFLAELAKVKRLFKSTISKMMRLQLPKDLRGFSRDWLEARYGWRTLLYDLQSLDSAIREFDSERSRYSERQGSTESWTSNNIETISGTDTTEVSTIDEIEVSIRGSVSADIEPERFRVSPINTAWELVPFSFVVDWLLNVGQSLMALTFFTQQTKSFASGGYKITIRRDWSRYTVAYGNNRSGQFRVSGFSEAELTERLPSSVPLQPLIRLRLDEFKILDLLALFAVRFK